MENINSKIRYITYLQYLCVNTSKIRKCIMDTYFIYLFLTFSLFY